MSDPDPYNPFVPPEPHDLAHLFPGYHIVRLIACGGMGAVYEAIQVSLDRVIAIKILPQEFTSDESFRDAFQTEARAMARLNHPNLIGVYDSGEVGGMLFIIMEYVPGASLFHAANGQAILQEEVAPLVMAICSGLAHAHENGIIHRDIKPANILLNHANEPKIGDFGLARPLERQIQEGEEIFGTPGYTAPEVVESPQSIDHRADIFSLGVLLHELLTGMLPDSDPRPASAICHCDPRFDAVIRNATHPLASQRYHSANEIAADIAKIQTTAGPRVLQTASTARKTPRMAPAYQPVRKNNGAKGWVVIMLLGAIGVVGFLYYEKANSQNGEFDEQPEVTVDQTATQDASTNQPPVAQPVETTPEPEKRLSNEPQIVDGVIHWNPATSKSEQANGKLNFEVTSGGIGGASDSGILKSQDWSGNGLFTIEIDSLDGVGGSAGLMIRETIHPGSRHAFLGRSAERETFLQLRSREDHKSQEFSRSSGSHRHLRVHRHGDTLAAYASNDGSTWEEVGIIHIKGLSSNILVGFAAASASESIPLTGAFNPLAATEINGGHSPEGDPLPRTNMNELFRRARAVMSERAKPIQDEYESSMRTNHASHLRTANQFYADFAEIQRDLELTGHIPYSLPRKFAKLEGFKDIHATHLARQQEIDRNFTQKMKDLEEVYRNGLNSQIQRSTAENDLGAVRVLEAENARLLDSPFYFRSLMTQSW